MSFTIADDHPALPGHFPGRPLVPAVMLIDLAAEAARTAFALGPLTVVTRAKFLAPIGPGETVQLGFARREDGAIAITGTCRGMRAFTIDARFAA